MKQIAIGMICLVLTACVSIAEGRPIVTDDKLAEIQARGTLVIATDASYLPQSQLVPGSKQRQGTRCDATQYSANQFQGFDVDVAMEIANSLGVEPCFVTPPWSQLVAGNWGDNWDIHVGSVAITYDRMHDLYFSSPYYATPTVIIVHKDNTTYRKASDLSDKRIGTCVACTFEDYLNGSLKIPGQTIEYRIHGAQIVAYENEDPAIEDLSLGDGVELDAVITILPKARAPLLPVNQSGYWTSRCSLPTLRSHSIALPAVPAGVCGSNLMTLSMIYTSATGFQSYLCNTRARI